MTSAAGIQSPILRISSPNKPDRGHCLINVFSQKGWRLQVPICITYLSGGADSANSNPQEVTANIFPIRWPHPLTSAEKLPSYQVLNMQAEYIMTGKYDNNLLYDTAQLISFPDMKLDSRSYATIQLHDNEEETINMRITIPQGFPDDLLNKPVFVEVHSILESLNSEASLTLCILVIDTSTGNENESNNEYNLA
jgi:hypothetical protein